MSGLDSSVIRVRDRPPAAHMTHGDVCWQQECGSVKRWGRFVEGGRRKQMSELV